MTDNFLHYYGTYIIINMIKNFIVIDCLIFK